MERMDTTCNCMANIRISGDKCLLKVRNDIIDVLQANRNTNESVRDTGFLSLFMGD